MPYMLSRLLPPSLLLLIPAARAGVHPVLVWALVGGLVTGAPSALRAEKADRFRPLVFAADSARVDDQQRVNILSGNVEITKGSIGLRAARVEVRQGQDGTQNAIATGGSNGRALFRQRREGVDETIEGEAERVEYDGRADVVRFTGRAVMRRLAGVTVIDEVVGHAIVYDNKTEVFQVLGGGGASAPSTRVRGVIGPRREPSAPEPTGLVPAAPPATDAGARLSATPTLSRPALESAR